MMMMAVWDARGNDKSSYR